MMLVGSCRAWQISAKIGGMTTNPPEELLTVAQLAERSGTPGRTIRLRAMRGDLPYVVKVHGHTGAYLFHPSTVELLKNRRRRPVAPSSAAVLPALVLPPGIEQGLQWLCIGIAGAMVVWGAQVLRETRRPLAPLAPIALGDRHATALADAMCEVDPIRGRVYNALGVEFWRSAFGQWLYADDRRCEAVTDRELLAALDAREARGWVL
jgi:hypothetical protein